MSEAVKTKLVGIETGRGIAAMLVVLYHTGRHFGKVYGPSWLSDLFQFGHAGVDFFFVISGFIILYTHDKDVGRPARLGHYLQRRFTRIMPTYWVALLVTVALSVAGGHALPAPFPAFWSTFLLPSFDEPLLGVAWTLQHEIVFYAFFALLILNRAGVAFLALWFFWIMLTTVGVLDSSLVPSTFTGAFNLEFFAGMAAAYWVKHRATPNPRSILAIGVLLFALAALAENAGWLDGYASIGRLAYGLPSALIVLAAAAVDRQAPIAFPKPLRVLGAASYSVYLFQFVFIGILWKIWLAAGLDRLLPQTAGFCLLAAGGIAGGVLASRLVEYPLMRLIRGERRPIGKAATEAAE
ncbi:MAG TPA: acyltransferase [Aliidongia sp.]|nr:acyltransferase [Aliidongia sp.]